MSMGGGALVYTAGRGGGDVTSSGLIVLSWPNVPGAVGAGGAAGANISGGARAASITWTYPLPACRAQRHPFTFLFSHGCGGMLGWQAGCESGWRFDWVGGLRESPAGGLNGWHGAGGQALPALRLPSNTRGYWYSANPHATATSASNFSTSSRSKLSPAFPATRAWLILHATSQDAVHDSGHFPERIEVDFGALSTNILRM